MLLVCCVDEVEHLPSGQVVNGLNRSQDRKLGQEHVPDGDERRVTQHPQVESRRVPYQVVQSRLLSHLITVLQIPHVLR